MSGQELRLAQVNFGYWSSHFGPGLCYSNKNKSQWLKFMKFKVEFPLIYVFPMDTPPIIDWTVLQYSFFLCLGSVIELCHFYLWSSHSLMKGRAGGQKWAGASHCCCLGWTWWWITPNSLWGLRSSSPLMLQSWVWMDHPKVPPCESSPGKRTI